MSSGHHLKSELNATELNDLLDEALADPRVKALLAKPVRIDVKHDIPLLGSSAIGWRVIYLDRHLHFRDWPYGFVPVDERRLDVREGLKRHEKLEPILENLYDWPYNIAHQVAQHYEERDYERRGFDPRDVEKAFAPYIRADEREPLKDVPPDLDLRPMLHDPKLLERTKESQDRQKRDHASVGYVAESKTNQRCASCKKFIADKYGGPACIGVKSPIDPMGWCRRFERGALDSPH